MEGSIIRRTVVYVNYYLSRNVGNGGAQRNTEHRGSGQGEEEEGQVYFVYIAFFPQTLNGTLFLNELTDTRMDHPNHNGSYHP